MKLSVIIPAYNAEMFLAETLDCLEKQTLKDIQIIIVNDGSTDKTAEIIAEYAKKNSNILPIYQFLHSYFLKFQVQFPKIQSVLA